MPITLLFHLHVFATIHLNIYLIYQGAYIDAFGCEGNLNFDGWFDTSTFTGVFTITGGRRSHLYFLLGTYMLVLALIVPYFPSCDCHLLYSIWAGTGDFSGAKGLINDAPSMDYSG